MLSGWFFFSVVFGREKKVFSLLKISKKHKNESGSKGGGRLGGQVLGVNSNGRSIDKRLNNRMY